MRPARLSLLAIGLCVLLTPTLRAEPDPCFVVDADYLLWFLKRDRVTVPLASTTSSAILTPGAFTSQTLYGNQDIGEDNPYSGLRLRAVLPAGDGLALEVGGFILERGVERFSADPASQFAQTALLRPVIDSTTGQQGFNVLNLDTVLAGSISVDSRTQFWGAEANIRSGNLGWGNTSAFAGYRYLGLHEQVAIQARSTVQLGGLGFFNGLPVSENDTRVAVDQFRTRNAFHGAQVGLLGSFGSSWLDVSFRSSVALGLTNQYLSVNGSTTLQTLAGGSATLPGGLLALPSNIRTETKNIFAVVPELDLSLGCQVASWLRLTVGYNAIYWSAVVRPGEQIDNTVTPAQVPTVPAYTGVASGAPVPAFRQSDFWAHGLNFGVTVTY